jgi:molybdate transport system substrate-binding protein
MQSIGPVSAPASVAIAAASDLKFALDELIAAYQTARPGRAIVATYGSSGNLFSQISNGAPFDLYFSADIDYPRRLETAGVAAVGATRSYGEGRLILWAPAGSPLDVAARGMDALADPQVRRVAIANPEHAPYGRAAVAALRSVGVYDAVVDRLVLGENVSQAAQFVESGAADLGIVALSLVRAPSLRGVGTYVAIPADLYPPIEQGAVVLGRAADPAAAGDFLDFVLSPIGRPVLERYGFVLPGA